MPKIINTPKNITPQVFSDWDVDIWNYEMYKKHTADFLQIQKEYQKIKERCVSEIMARWYWLESKGAIKLKLYMGILEPCSRASSYHNYENMFTKYCDWSAMEEKKMGVQTPDMEKVISAGKENKEKKINNFTELIDFSEKEDFKLFVKNTTDMF